MSNLILSTAKAQNHTIFLRSLMNFQKTVICSHDSSPLHMLKNSQSQDLKYQQIGQNLQSAMEQLQQTKHIIQNLTERLEEAENQLNHVNNLNQSLQVQNSLMKKEFQVQERYCKEVCNLNSLFENRIQVLQHQKQNSEELAQHHLDDLELFRQQQSHYQAILSQQLNDLNVKLDQKQDQIAHLSVECAAHKSSQCGKCPLYEFDIQTLQTKCQKLEETLFSERQRFHTEREKLVRDHSAISQFAKQMLEDDLKSQSTVEMDKDYLTKLVAKLQSDKGKLQAQVEVLSRDKSILQNLQPHDLEFSCQQNESQSVLLRSVLFYEQKFTEFAAEAVSQSQQLENLLALVESKSQQTQELEKEVDSLLQIKSGAGLRNVSAVKRISSLQSKICELEQQQGSNLDQKSIKQKLDELALLVGVDNCSDIVLNLQLLQEIEVNDEKSEQLLLDGCSIVEQKIHTLRNQLQVGLKQLLHMLEM